jgi:hypothetical protein
MQHLLIGESLGRRADFEHRSQSFMPSASEAMQKNLVFYERLLDGR